MQHGDLDRNKKNVISGKTCEIGTSTISTLPMDVLVTPFHCDMLSKRILKENGIYFAPCFFIFQFTFGRFFCSYDHGKAETL